jgi:hypothetical protein
MADHPHPTLPELLSTRARRASDLRLAADVAVGVTVAFVAGIVQPAGWHLLLSAGVCVGAFGAWGIADRELRERGEGTASARWLRTARLAAALLGALAAVALFLRIFALLLGTWIS